MNIHSPCITHPEVHHSTQGTGPRFPGVPTGGDLGCVPYFGHGDGTEHFSVSGQAPPCPTQCGNANFGRASGAAPG